MQLQTVNITRQPVAAPHEIRRLSADEAERVNDWVWRDSGQRPDFTPFLADRNNVCLACGEGGAIFVWRGPGIYEVHVFFEQRGKEVLRVSREMLEIMRSNYGAALFWSAVPVASRHVIMFTRLMGWRSQGTTMFAHGLCEVFSSEGPSCRQ